MSTEQELANQGTSSERHLTTNAFYSSASISTGAFSLRGSLDIPRNSSLHDRSILVQDLLSAVLAVFTL